MKQAFRSHVEVDAAARAHLVLFVVAGRIAGLQISPNDMPWNDSTKRSPGVQEVPL